jgi:choline-sulfatase
MSTKPNVLWIMSDQHSPRISGFAGDPDARTENLDALAARSAQFDNAVTASPCCTPSRMTILTAKEPHRASAWFNHWPIFPEHTTWPAHLANHGYTTGLVGKMHIGGKDQMVGFQHRPYGDIRHGVSHQAEPIDLFPGYAHMESAGATEIPESLLQDAVVSKEALSFILEQESESPETPWFVCASYTRPHYPLTSPGRYYRRYKDKLPPADLAPDHKNRLEPYALTCYMSEMAGDDNDFVLSPELNQHAREGYYGALDYVDDCIGELLDGLEDAGLLDNTIVIYTTDHGEMGGAHGLWGKIVYYDESIRVPMLISGPGVRSGRVDQPISQMDLFPTTCGLLDIPIPEGLDGVDFSGVLADPDGAPSPREFAPSSYYLYGSPIGPIADAPPEDTPNRAMRAIRDKDWTYVEIEGGQPLLFDRSNDPDEEVNLAAQPEHAERARKMRGQLFEGFSWEQVHAQLEIDRKRVPEFASGLKPSTPNQYMLRDGRTFDAEESLYGARWLYMPPEGRAGIIPQRYG